MVIPNSRSSAWDVSDDSFEPSSEPLGLAEHPVFTPPPARGPQFQVIRRLLVLLLVGFLVLSVVAIVDSVTTPPLSPIAAKVDPAVVDVTTSLAYEQGGMAGTGIVLGSGYVLTNNHVIVEAATVRVRDVGNGRTYAGTVVGTDIVDDLALVELKGAPHLNTVEIGNSSTLTIGQAVVAIGNAGGKGGTPTVTSGVIVALDRSIVASSELGETETLKGMIEMSAGLQPGDSGGPLVNGAGRVIGIDTAGSESSSGPDFAIPINKAMAVARQIEAGRTSGNVHVGPTPFLGVSVVESTGYPGVPYVPGALVTEVASGSPAEKAGLVPGDVIVSIGGTSITSPTGLEEGLQPFHPGDSVEVVWVDGFGTTHSAQVELATGPPL